MTGIAVWVTRALQTAVMFTWLWPALTLWLPRYCYGQ
jgi:hypothetical protein